MKMPPFRSQLATSPEAPLHAALWACAAPLALILAYSCSYNLLLFAPSIYLLQIYDRVLSSRSADTLLMLTLIVAATVAVGGVLDALRRAVLGRLGAWLEDRLRPCVLAACLESALKGDPATAAQAFRDLSLLRQFVESSACPMLLDALWAPLFLGVLFLIHPLLGIVGACSITLLFALALLGDLLTEHPVSRSAAALATSCQRLATAMGNIQLIRTMGMLDGAARLIYRPAEEARKERELALRRYEILMLLAKPTRALSQVLIMGAAAWLVLEQGKTPAIIFAATLMFGRALAPVEGAIASWKALAGAVSAYQRIAGVLALLPPASAKTGVPERLRHGLLVENVGVLCPGSPRLLLKGVSFRLAPGECLGIIGPSGAGKSLLGQVLAGLLVPSHGRVLLDDVELSRLRDTGQARHLGYLPQDIELVGETVAEIIGRLDDSDPQLLVQAARLAGVHDSIMQLPRGYDTAIGNAGLAFSRGYRQRLGLARAFFGAPRLIVLDEPNASLDYAGERMLLDAIRQLKSANAIVVIVTHRMGVLAATSKIAIMEGGAVAALGESEEIFERYLSRPQLAAQAVLPGEEGEGGRPGARDRSRTG